MFDDSASTPCVHNRANARPATTMRSRPTAMITPTGCSAKRPKSEGPNFAQFGAGSSVWSMTSVSTGPVAGTSLRPSWSCRACWRVGLGDSVGVAAAGAEVCCDHSTVKSKVLASCVRSSTGRFRPARATKNPSPNRYRVDASTSKKADGKCFPITAPRSNWFWLKRWCRRFGRSVFREN